MGSNRTGTVTLYSTALLWPGAPLRPLPQKTRKNEPRSAPKEACASKGIGVNPDIDYQLSHYLRLVAFLFESGLCGLIEHLGKKLEK